MYVIVYCKHVIISDQSKKVKNILKLYVRLPVAEF